MALDLITALIDLFSIGVLVFVVFIGSKTVHAFRQSKQAVTESASLLSVIVGALTSRVQASESLVSDFAARFDAFDERTSRLEGEQSSFHGSYLQMLGYLQEVLSNDKRLILELEELKGRLTSIQQPRIVARNQPSGERAERLPVPAENVLASLTSTERHTLDILGREGSKSAPELGRRMKKSREHMARLMKKLYLDGYVDKESNRAPFRYRLNDKIGPILGDGEQSVTAEPSAKA